MSSRTHRKLSPLTTNWSNRSHSSINSDASVFYSALAHPTPIELKQQIPQSPSSRALPHTISSPREFCPTKMNRQDSGYAENVSYIPSHMRTSSRPSSKSSSHNPRPSLNASRKSSSRSKDSSSTSSSASSATSRSTPKRCPKSPRTSTSHSRPNVSRHHHSQTLSTPPQYQYFHFPSLSDDLPQETSNPTSTVAPPPPATIHYWTSDQTRRLEYAAIDAASKGIRGFVTRCIPDCFLPAEKRGNRFCQEDMREGDDDAGSVRRYRLVMEDEVENEMKGERIKDRAQSVKEHRRRWSSFIRR
ncbi:uncharacterized protein EAF02_000284 [Botrytis sinoallii]|uniref:uncharacterized protein n=1 Tax=Botrytis sinoallii TaxID=1463999 RepID=UPI001900C7D5|nr:uncharacterized protein EAF02_000284 [Botrytis sinoallii]KAF7892746.1 hypothetical protein EAF02_000284 [Botrytis sinoallii]